jgi:phosphoribosylglycinamide formyltransferase-1
MRRYVIINQPFRIVVCASGGGGNFQALIDAQEELGIEISKLIVDRPCGAVDRACAHGIPCEALDASGVKEAFSVAFEHAVPQSTDLIVLAGFMPIIPKNFCDKWHLKIINTHPSLLPKYGGRGMYGVKVQEAVMHANEEEAGCTVHYVNAGIDEGQIILQKTIKVDPVETPWQLGGRIFQEENKLLVAAVRLIKSQMTQLNGDK